MSDHHNNHHHQHRPNRISVPPRTTTTTRPNHLLHTFPQPSTPTPTPSKTRLPTFSPKPSTATTSSLSFLFLLLFSLRSLYSLLPFLRSSPSFSLFPFSFLLSLSSFLFSLLFSLLTPKSRHPIFSLTLISHSQLRLLITKSFLLATVFLLRFQALRYCGAAAMILAELSGNVTARFFAEGNRNLGRIGPAKIRGFFALLIGLFLLSISWDRIKCFPKIGFNENCVRVWPMLLPFLSGFLGCYERVSMNWGTIRQLGQKRVRLISLFFATVMLFFPAVVSVFVIESNENGVSFGNFGWPLANSVVFGVLLSENFSEEKLVSSKDFQREFIVTFVCTLVLELFYYPELSLWGLLICGFSLWIAVRELDPFDSNYLELGLDSSESLTTLIMRPIRHILSERKSRKIALFLLINAGYMVVEFVAGFMSNSLGLISDACHMLFDCAALAIGLYASYISRLPANYQFNYGRGRFEVLSGYVNAVFLVLVGALIVLESFERILDPQEISTNSLLSVSIGGLFVNVVGLIFFHEEHHHAHGGSGPCSHSHSHTHEHSHTHDSGHSHSHGEHHHAHAQTHENSHTHDSCHSHSHGEHHHAHGESGSCSHKHHHHHESESCSHSHSHSHSDHSHHDYTDTNREHEHDHDHDSHHNHHDHAIHGHSHPLEHHTLVGSQIENRGSDLKTHSQPKKVEEPHKHHRHIDHNMEGIFLHVLADTMGSVGVVVSTLLIKYKGWLVADPACSIFISVLIVASVIPLLRNSAEVLLQRVPKAHEHELKEALNSVMKIGGVSGIHNLHVWSFTNTDVVGTLHLHVSNETDKAYVKEQVSHILHDAGVKDLTMQVECIKA